MKALLFTQVVLWENGTYTISCTAADTFRVPFNSSQGGRANDEEGIKQHLVDWKHQIDQWNQKSKSDTERTSP